MRMTIAEIYRYSRLYVPRPAPDASSMEKNEYETSCVQHFHDKLLRLKDRMKTIQGRRMAVSRQEMMQLFLRQLEAEVA